MEIAEIAEMVANGKPGAGQLHNELLRHLAPQFSPSAAAYLDNSQMPYPTVGYKYDRDAIYEVFSNLRYASQWGTVEINNYTKALGGIIVPRRIRDLFGSLTNLVTGQFDNRSIYGNEILIDILFCEILEILRDHPELAYEEIWAQINEAKKIESMRDSKKFKGFLDDWYQIASTHVDGDEILM